MKTIELKKGKIYLRIITLVLLILMFCQLAGCTGDGNDLYAGKYVSVDDLDGEMEIKKEKDHYKIYINFYGLTYINATGELDNGTLYYFGEDKYGDEIYGNIEEYGEYYPVRVEMYGDGLSDEFEFERVK